MKSFGYNNFIRSSEHSVCNNQNNESKLSGDDARKFYLEEFSNVKSTESYIKHDDISKKKHEENTFEENVNDKDIFYSVQNNDIVTLTRALEQLPEKVNLKDGYGWSLLMIACQANSVDVVKELLKRRADTTIRDRAGNSAQSLIIKNKNTRLAEIIFNHDNQHTSAVLNKNDKVKSSKNDMHFVCDICNRQTFLDQGRHLSSTIHNIHLSKHNKCKPWYAIPESNKGYQIMVKGGWNRLDGLGPNGSGKKYPIKTIQKLDRKGLGQETKKVYKSDQEIRNMGNVKLKFCEREYKKQKRMEMNFRREFY